MFSDIAYDLHVELLDFSLSQLKSTAVTLHEKVLISNWIKQPQVVYQNGIKLIDRNIVPFSFHACCACSGVNSSNLRDLLDREGYLQTSKRNLDSMKLFESQYEFNYFKTIYLGWYLLIDSDEEDQPNKSVDTTPVFEFYPTENVSKTIPEVVDTPVLVTKQVYTEKQRKFFEKQITLF